MDCNTYTFAPYAHMHYAAWPLYIMKASGLPGCISYPSLYMQAPVDKIPAELQRNCHLAVNILCCFHCTIRPLQVPLGG